MRAKILSALLILVSTVSSAPPPKEPAPGHNYITAVATVPPVEFAHGFAVYTPMTVLLAQPLENFNFGLGGIWIRPRNEDATEALLPKGTVARDSMPQRGPLWNTGFQTIEGGCGFWEHTQFPSAIPKFRMNGTPDGYTHQVSSTGWSFKAQPLPDGWLGIAQVSPRLLVPPDGVTFSPQTRGELFVYGWMSLPLLSAKTRSDDPAKSVGDQHWTLFIRASNYSGPVAFYTPITWTRIGRMHAPAISRGLDTRAGRISGGGVESGQMPGKTLEDSKGGKWTRIPKVSFPVDDKGVSILFHGLKSFSREALISPFLSLTNPASQVAPFPKGSLFHPTLTARSQLNFFFTKDKWPIRGLDAFVSTGIENSDTFVLTWKPQAIESSGEGRFASFPEYYRHGDKEVFAVKTSDVPPEVRQVPVTFPTKARNPVAYPDALKRGGFWSSPGPVAGPFYARLSDGSKVTYHWYRFIDQPALLAAELTEAERNRLQATIENIHRRWNSNEISLPPPRVGSLASLDEGIFVSPPAGLEIGYVPVATAQE